MSTHVLSPFPEYAPPPPAPPAKWCTACLDRIGKQVRAYRVGLCRECFAFDDDPQDLGPIHPIFSHERQLAREKAQRLPRAESRKQERERKLAEEAAARENSIRLAAERAKLRDLSARNIMEAVADHYGLDPLALTSRLHKGTPIEARHLLRYLLREMLSLSLAQIGKVVGAHHSSVLHSLYAIKMREWKYETPIRELKKKFHKELI